MQRRPLLHQAITHSMIGGFYAVHSQLGFGFLEHTYMKALERELRARGHQVGREVWVSVYHSGELLGRQRIDMLVDEKVVLEGKSTFELRKDVRRQLYNYLSATDLEVGLLLHFGPVPRFYRVVSLNVPRASGESVISESSD